MNTVFGAHWVSDIRRDTLPVQVQQAVAHLAAIVASLDDAIISKNLDGCILSWNAAAQRIFGYSAEEAVGRSIHLIIPRDRLEEQSGREPRYPLAFDREPPPPPISSAKPHDAIVPLEAILRTDELQERPTRPPDHETENRALNALVEALADSPRTVLQALADKVLEVLRAGSSGLSLLTETGERFYWAAIAGAWQPHLGGGTPRDFGPCGDVLDCDAPLLFTHWEQRYPYLASAIPLAEEGLLVPFRVGGRTVGTIWAISHDPQHRFDREDLRLLESLGRFASVAYQAVELLGAVEQRRAALNLLEDAVHAR